MFVVYTLIRGECDEIGTPFLRVFFLVCVFLMVYVDYPCESTHASRSLKKFEKARASLKIP